jgi:nucleotide-binding universal stress UspA family protein
LVLGARKHAAIADWFLGSTAGYVVKHCQVPVLVVPPHCAVT